VFFSTPYSLPPYCRERSDVRIGVTIFPGSNCDRDALYAVERMGAAPVELWHADADLKGVDAVIVPGGFSYGDYLRPGAIARFARVMAPLEDFARSGGPILGVCNGFQVLTEAHLLPGALLRNSHMRFVCLRVRVRVETTQTPWTSACEPGEVLTLPVAHNEGNYFADPTTIEELEAEERVVLRYLENPNGSANDIAGICNEERNVVGIMPHPERVSDGALGSDEGLRILRSVFAGARV
jgi:phosphoribosylformylglycinamidine synthase I